MSKRSPYQGLPRQAFWRTGVAGTTPETIQNLWTAKTPIEPTTKVATAGSCFAQHIARFLRQRDCKVLDVEPPPPGLDQETAHAFGYSMYSARYGNIYTARQLLQLTREAFSGQPLADCVWERDGRYFDAYRPSVEPEGLGSPDAVRMHRLRHLERVRQLFESADLLVFTMGLTEGWIDRDSGHVFPTAPGTIAGDYDPERFVFKNFGFSETLEDFVEVRSLLQARNPGLRFLLTVSPVPLTATASGKHVLTATTYSKSVLRAVAGQLSDTYGDVDYFPSYEIIATPFSRGAFYEPNLREVREAGVRTVMSVFFGEKLSEPDVTVADAAVSEQAPEHRAGRTTGAKPVDREAKRARKARRELRRKAGDTETADVVCEDVLLDAFAK